MESYASAPMASRPKPIAIRALPGTEAFAAATSNSAAISCPLGPGRPYRVPQHHLLPYRPGQLLRDAPPTAGTAFGRQRGAVSAMIWPGVASLRWRFFAR